MTFYNPLVKIIDISHRDCGRQGLGKWIDDLDMWIVLFSDDKEPCAALCLVADINVLYVKEQRPDKGDVWQN